MESGEYKNESYHFIKLGIKIKVYLCLSIILSNPYILYYHFNSATPFSLSGKHLPKLIQPLVASYSV
ncbi:hypothetical protein D3C80_2096430 [compost metagenome]